MCNIGRTANVQNDDILNSTNHGSVQVLSRGTCHYGSKVEIACKINNSKCFYSGKKGNENHSISEILSFVGLLCKFATTWGTERVTEMSGMV